MFTLPPRRTCTRYCLLLCLLAAVFSAAFCPDAPAAPRERRAVEPHPTPLKPETFAARLILDGQQGALLQLPLGASVYSRLVRRDFRDLCVFDRSGTPVPFTLRDREKENTTLVTRTPDIPYFSWRPPQGEAQALPRRTDVEISMNGGIVRVHSENGFTPPPAADREILLLDLSALLDNTRDPVSESGVTFTKDELQALTLLLLPETTDDFSAKATLQTSQDLTHWSGIGAAQMLARFSKGQDSIERLTLALPRDCGRYLLLTMKGDVPNVRAFNAEAHFAKSVVPEKESLVAGQLADNARSVFYDTGGSFPLNAIGFDLPQADIMAVRLEAAQKADGPWSAAASGAMYRLEKDGMVVNSDPFPVSANVSRSRYWRLTASGDIPFAFAPSLRLRWTPHTLVFLARGQGPWTLAYGRKEPVAAAPLPLSGMGAFSPATVVEQPAPPAQPPALSSETWWGLGNLATGQWVLWTALGLAVVFLSGLALYLARSMGTDGKGIDGAPPPQTPPPGE